jgi:hypothetical protein
MPSAFNSYAIGAIEIADRFDAVPKFDVAAASVDKRVDPGLGLGFKGWIVTLILGGLGSIFFGIEFIPW